MDDSFVNLGVEVILTFAMTISDCKYVLLLVVLLKYCYWLFKCRDLCACVCHRGLFANTYKHHRCVCHATLFPSRAWTDGKTKNIINFLYYNLDLLKLKLTIMEMGVTFQTRIVVLANQSRLRLSDEGAL